MPFIFDIKVPVEQESSLDSPILLAAKHKKIEESSIQQCKLIKRSIDARKKPILLNLRYEAYLNSEEIPEEQAPFSWKNVSNAPEVHIIGCGPAGLFAALSLINEGKKPVILERGKDVRDRRRDLAKINKEHLVNAESNYCFGEGGAGTYSDGKLYTRSKKRGDVLQILKTLVEFGADEKILQEAQPHIGTNKLPKIIVSIREKIIECGGEILFNSKLTDLNTVDNTINEIEVNNNNWIKINQLILATGHSARDIFELLEKKKIEIKPKPFALGVRIEHPQTLIDKIQYKQESGEYLPPAAYKIVKQVNGRGVYSFCMCPGGIIAPCATSSGEIVSNGWSPSRRNNPFANSGIVVSVEEKDWSAYKKYGNLAAMYFQKNIEELAFKSVNEGNTQYAPAQRLIDFIEGKRSKNLPNCSYQPGVISARVDKILPNFISSRLKQAFILFGRSMKGYLTNDAIIVGVESRTSSPVSIPRNKENMQHPEIKNLFPIGEGAGYAGGIVSAAIDGVKAGISVV